MLICEGIKYFAVNLLALLVIFQWGSKLSNNKRVLLWGILLLVWGSEIHFQHVGRFKVRSYELPTYEWAKQINLESYDAILGLPFYAVGSENYGIAPQAETQKHASWLALQTGIPVVNFCLSRTPFDYNWTQLQRFHFDNQNPASLKDLSGRRYLVLWVKQGTGINDRARRIIDQMEVIHEDEKMKVGSIRGEEIAQIEVKRLQQLEGEFNKLMNDSSAFVLPDSAKVSYVHFDQPTNTKSNVLGYRSTGSKSQQQPVTLFEGTLPTRENHVLSCWIDLYKPGESPLRLEFLAKDQWQYGHELQRYIDRIDGHWVRISVPLDSTLQSNPFKLWVRSSDNNNEFYTVDEILLRPQRIDVPYRNTDSRSFNNEFF